MDNKYKIAAAIFILLFTCYLYFLQQPWNWNSVSRLALTFAMVEEGGLSIDTYHKPTGDKAYYNGRFYSDKAPGMSFMAYPYAASVKYVLDSLSSHLSWVQYEGDKIVWVDKDGKITPPFRLVNQIVTNLTSGLITVLAALAVYFVAIRLGATLGGAVFGALAYGLATPAWGWATAFFGHASAGGCLFLGFASVFFLLQRPGGALRDILLGFVSGALLSWAVVIEYTSAPASVIIALYGIYNARVWERRRIVRVVLSTAAGALIFISPLLLYNHAVTGDPFGSLYKYSVYFPYMKEGFYGLMYPDIGVLIKLLFSGRYGILTFSPILIAVPPALWTIWHYKGSKSLVVTLTAIALYYLLWNSAYIYWSGGGSTTPRYLTPMLPFLCLPLAVLWSESGNRFKAVLLALFALSFLISLMSVSVSMMEGGFTEVNMVTQYLISRFFAGDINQLSIQVKLIFLGPAGEGYTGQLVLIPLYIIIAACLAYILGLLKKADRT